MSNKRKIKRLSKHTFVAKDPNIGTEFYMKLNTYSDISVLVFDPEHKTFREFIVDASSLMAIYQFVEDKPIKPNTELVKGELPYYVKLLAKGSTIMASRVGKLYGSVLLANTAKFGENNEAITLRRVAYSPSKDNYLLGVDTLSLSLHIATELLDSVMKKFDKNDMILEFEGEEINED